MYILKSHTGQQEMYFRNNTIFPTIPRLFVSSTSLGTLNSAFNKTTLLLPVGRFRAENLTSRSVHSECKTIRKDELIVRSER